MTLPKQNLFNNPHQREYLKWDSATGVTSDSILEEGTPQLQPTDASPEHPELQQSNVGSKRKRRNKLSVTQIKKANAAAAVTPAELRTPDIPIDLESFAVNDFPHPAYSSSRLAKQPRACDVESAILNNTP